MRERKLSLSAEPGRVLITRNVRVGFVQEALNRFEMGVILKK
jgi:hypothetical protein